MNVKSLLSLLAQSDIRINAQDNQLRINAPQGALTPELKALLVTHKKALIELLSQAQEQPRHWPPPIKARDSQTPPVMSLAQQRLWLLHQLEGPNHAYNLLFGLELKGLVQIGPLASAMQMMVARHEALRQAFGTPEDPMAIRLRDSQDFEIKQLDFKSVPNAESTMRAAIECEGKYCFDLEHDWLIRAHFFHLTENHLVLLVNLHHMVSDGWSLGIFTKELVALYEAAKHAKPPALAPLPLHYSDYAAWQRTLLEHSEGKVQLDYWLKTLKGSPKLLQLPTDHPRPAAQAFHGRRLPWQFGPKQVNALKALCEAGQVTPFMVLESIFALLLQRYSGQNEINIGIPLANRTTPELELLQGMFVNTVVLRHAFHNDLSFRELLEQVRSKSLEAFDRADIPFEHIIAELNPERSLAYSPVFQAMFILQNQPFEQATIDDLEFRLLDIPRTSTKLDLTMSITATEPVLEGSLEYNSSLFTEATIARLITHFGNLLLAAANQPDSHISRLELLDESERFRMLHHWNPSAIQNPQLLIHELFEQKAREIPNHIALGFGQGPARRELTYAELNRMANQLAADMIQHGAGPDTFTAIFLDRSIEMVIALLASLKAGSAYVPLDPEFPDKRLALMFADSKPKMVITSQALEHRVPEFISHRLHVSVAGGVDQNPEVLIGQEARAYVIYTSGSTGQPKGVVVGHASVVNFLQSMSQKPGLDAADVLLAVTTVSFDIAGLEIFLPLTCGARLELASKEDALDGVALSKMIESQAITVMQATPATWKLLLASGWSGAQHLKILCGGEALQRTLADSLLPKCRELWNMYGPTEATIWASCCQVSQSTHSQQDVPLGEPIANTQFYILDRHLAPVPQGVAGQLFIGGKGLAAGYYQQEALTQKVFINDPFASSAVPHQTAKIYATGDLVKRNASGELVFLGRLDNQIKLNGFRIELGDIEAALVRHPQIKEAVVILNHDNQRDELIAYLVTEEQASFSEGSSSWRSYLQAELQWYMIPSSFILIDSIPLTPNKKLDRSALPKPKTQAVKTSYEAPHTNLEQQLVTIWKAQLGKEPIGIRDNFFELGGHSLIAAKLVHAMNHELGTQLPMRILFSHPTIAECAAEIEAQASASPQDSNSSNTWPRISPNQEQRFEPFPLTDVQFAYWIGRSGMVTLGDVATHIYSEHDSPTLDLAQCEAAINHLIQRHDMLRAIIQPDGSQVVQQNVPYYKIKVEDLRKLGPEATQKKLQAKRETLSHQVLPADKWPLFHIESTLHSGNQIRFHISMDALITDGWSMRLLSREFLEVYGNLHLEMRTPQIQFRDYVLAEHALEKDQKYANAKTYWTQRIEQMPEGPSLVLALNPEELKQQRFERRTATLSVERWAQIQERARFAGVTPSALLLTAFASVLDAWSTSSHFTLNLTLFNRLPLHEDVNALVGDFTSLLLLEVDHRAPQSFTQRARVLQDQLWSDWEHRLFSGIQVLHEMAKVRREAPPTFPVVFTSMLGMESAPSDLAKDHELNHVFSLTQTPQVWLDHQVSERDGQLVFSWDAIPELFHPQMLDDMFSSYNVLLERLAGDDGFWQQSYQDLLPESQRLVRQAVNATQAPLPTALLQSGFIQQAQLVPENLAVIAPNRQLNYRTLMDEACQVAQVLKARGVGREEFVAIVMEKGWEQVVAALGVLFAGAAYMPVDAHWPQQRQHDLLQTTKVHHVLTQAHLTNQLTWPEGIQELVIGSETCQNAPKALPEQTTTPQELAYVIFTSGSSGKPKGVAIEHHSAVNTIEDINRRFEVCPKDRVLALSSLHFDLSVYDLFGLLGAGGALVLPAPQHLKDPSKWALLMARHNVSVWNTVPALMAMLAHHLKANPKSIPNDVRFTMMSGDWIPLDLPALLWELMPNLDVISLGGATEASIWSNYFHVQEMDPQWQSIPYGKPLTNQFFAVLNSRLEPCPDWVAGDLYIGGVGLARKYWGDPEKTAKAFITHPQTGQRLYKTGDLGRYFPDGNLEFLGRKDAQVKIQGHRIELGEIETALRDHPAIKQAVVAAKGKDRHNKRLIAYYILKPVANASEPQAFIEDPLKRFAFKLAHHNLKDFTPEVDSLSLEPLDSEHQANYLKRQSFRSFKSDTIDGHSLLKLIQTLQPMSWEKDEIPKYRYPSAGSLYPVQTYLFVKPNRVAGIEGGFYYFHPAESALQRTSDHHQLDANFFGAVNRNIGDQIAFALFLVGKLSAIQPLYGERARDFCLLEAGHMGQLLMDQGPQFGLGLCPIGSVAFDQISDHLQVEPNCFPAYTLVGGGIRAEQLQNLSSQQDSDMLRQFTSLMSKDGEDPSLAAVPALTTPSTASKQQEEAFISHLRKRLPEYMVPSQFQMMTAMPLTANGKVNRDLLPEPKALTSAEPAKMEQVAEKPHVALPNNHIEAQITDVWKRHLELDTIGNAQNFFDLGGNSVLIIKIQNDLNRIFEIDISIVNMFRLPTITALAEHIATLKTDLQTAPVKATPNVPVPPKASSQDIAIIGFDVRFPDAPNADTFWQNLKDGVESLRPFSQEELQEAGSDDSIQKNSNFVNAGSTIDDADLFDASFFNMRPQEVEIMDPQQRLFLECVYKALENSGYANEAGRGRVGLFAGTGTNTYLLRNILNHPEATQNIDPFQVLLSNGTDYFATRIAYKLNLRGPSLTVQTACSTSLVSVHLACQALIRGECDLAIAGGSNIYTPQKKGYVFQEGFFLSADGHCRPFDANASGTVFGNGLGSVILKPLEDAMRDGDTVHAVIKGSAINNDGSDKVGFTAPSIQGQLEVIQKALNSSGLAGDQISYVETHGTGTILGDPIEVEALRQGYGHSNQQRCALGSVKANLGHLEAAAGIAGLIKTTLMLKHKQLLPSINFQAPNPKIDFENSAFFVNTSLRPWESEGTRFAGVSSFGIGGTNAHVILGEAPQPSVQPTRVSHELLTFSAKTASALDQMKANMAAFLEAHPQTSLSHVAHTLQLGRNRFPHSEFVVARDTTHAVELLGKQKASQRQHTQANHYLETVFMFPGQGSQYLNMAAELYDALPQFQVLLDQAFKQATSVMALDPKALLFATAGSFSDRASKLTQTQYAQPLLFLVEYSLAKLWMQWGLRPKAMIGHSLGELTAGCIAGVMTFEDALMVVIERGRLMQSMKPGSMVSVALSEPEVEKLLSGGLTLAAVNSKNRCTVSGPGAEIDALLESCKTQDLVAHRLHTSHAFHSAMMDPMLDDFVAVFDQIKLAPAQIPFISCVTGTWIQPEQATNPQYWADQLRSTVQFKKGLATLLDRPQTAFLEVGPGTSLCKLWRQEAGPNTVHLPLHSLPDANSDQPDSAVLFESLGHMWLHHAPVSWEKVHAGQGRKRIPLPTYPFEKKSFWIHKKQTTPTGSGQLLSHGEPKTNPTYLPHWQRVSPMFTAESSLGVDLIFEEGSGLGKTLFDHFKEKGRQVFLVEQGSTFQQLDPDSFTVNMNEKSGFSQMLNHLPKDEPLSRIHYLAGTNAKLSDEHAYAGFNHLLFLFQALESHATKATIHFNLITSGLWEVLGDETLQPLNALQLGPLRTSRFESTKLHCRVIDVIQPQNTPNKLGHWVTKLDHQLSQTIAQPYLELALRGEHFWQRTMAPSDLPSQHAKPERIKHQGVYLITGGLRGIGLVLAQYLATNYQAKLVLLTRSRFPDQATWDQWSPGSPLGETIATLKTMIEGGAQVSVLQGDVTDLKRMREVILTIRQTFGALNGIVHAAGLPGGGLMQLKEAKDAANVLEPKVKGAFVLSEATRDCDLDFTVYYSSVLGEFGGLGQVDYCAANAFLDAHAHERTQSGLPTFSIGWDGWAETGMADRARRGEKTPSWNHFKPVSLPLFSAKADQDGVTLYYGRLDPAKDWIVQEHSVGNAPTVPGTAYLEMAASAYRHHTGQDRLQISDVFFLKPLQTSEQHPLTYQLVFQPKHDGFSFEIRSTGPDGQWLQHAKGFVSPLNEPAHESLDLDDGQFQARFKQYVQPEISNEAGKKGLVEVGPRWNNAQWVGFDGTSGFAQLELAEAFQDDLRHFHLHPAMLDIATGFSSLNLTGHHLPFSYQKFKVFGPIPSQLHAYFQEKAAGENLKEFDVVLADSKGQCVVAIEGFGLMHIPATDQPPKNLAIARKKAAPGLSNAEGLSAFEQIMGQHIAQVAVSHRNIHQAVATQLAHSQKANYRQGSSSVRHKRPELETQYSEPQNATEKKLTEIWQELLGLEQVGIHDSFLDLGGDSLAATQLSNLVSAAFGEDIPLTVFFESSTIAKLAEYIDAIQLASQHLSEPLDHQELLELGEL